MAVTAYPSDNDDYYPEYSAWEQDLYLSAYESDYAEGGLPEDYYDPDNQGYPGYDLYTFPEPDCN